MTVWKRKRQPYSYDVRGRLSQVTGSRPHQYTFDPNGNRISADGVSATFDAQDRLVQNGSVRYTYTGHGVLASKQNLDGSNRTEYVYDDFGQLVRVQMPDGKLIEYLVGGENQRLVKKVNGTVVQQFTYYSENQMAAEHFPDGTIKSVFVYGEDSHSPDYMIRSGISYRFVKDQLGSPRLIINTSTGNIVQRIDYDDFGSVLADTNPGFQPFGFAGGLYDVDTMLVRFGARDYDSHVGRWTSKDPILFEGGDIGLYSYATSDPVNNIDPLGLQVPNPYPPFPIPAPPKGGGSGPGAGSGSPPGETCAAPPRPVGAPVVPVGPENNPNRRKSPEECSNQNAEEIAYCSSFSDPRARSACYAAANTRYGECLAKGNSTTPLPSSF